MTIRLYKVTDEKNKVTKTLSSELSLTGDLKEESDVINPVITINATNLSTYNYMYIEDFSRYYYITDITLIRDTIWRIQCHVDTLMTYGNQIRQQDCIVEKTESSNYSSLLYNDGSFRTLEDSFAEVTNFQNGFTDTGELILLTAGT